jgi:hypothetical protein
MVPFALQSTATPELFRMAFGQTLCGIMTVVKAPNVVNVSARQ